MSTQHAKFLSKATSTVLWGIGWGILPVRMKHVQNINSFIHCFRNPEALLPLNTMAARVHWSEAKACLLQKRHELHWLEVSCFLLAWGSGEAGRGHTILVHAESHPYFPWNTAETEFCSISIWNHNSPQIHLKWPPTSFNWGRFTLSFVISSKPLSELDLNLRFWCKVWSFPSGASQDPWLSPAVIWNPIRFTSDHME